MADTECIAGADPEFEKEEAQRVLGLAPKNFFANLEDFLKNLAQKGVGVPPCSGSAPA